MLIYTAILLLSVFGIFICNDIYHQKKKAAHRPLVCEPGFNCDAVLRSRFADLFGIPLEIWGILYYALIFLTYLVLLVAHQYIPQVASSFLSFLLLGITSAAFLLSLYLIFVQAFYIKNWCLWCLKSAGTSILIFVFATMPLWLANVFGVERLPETVTPELAVSVLSIIAALTPTMLYLFVLALVVMLVASVLSFFLLLRCFLDLKVADQEQSVIQTVSMIFWIALFMVLLNGTGLYAVGTTYAFSATHLVFGTVTLAVAIISNLILYLVITPRIIDTSCGCTLSIQKISQRRFHALLAGIISIVSIVCTMMLFMIPHTSSDVATLATQYVTFLFLGMVIACFINTLLGKRVRVCDNLPHGNT